LNGTVDEPVGPILGQNQKALVWGRVPDVIYGLSMSGFDSPTATYQYDIIQWNPMDFTSSIVFPLYRAVPAMLDGYVLDLEDSSHFYIVRQFSPNDEKYVTTYKREDGTQTHQCTIQGGSSVATWQGVANVAYKGKIVIVDDGGALGNTGNVFLLDPQTCEKT